jgi:hypothetical protein
MAHKRRPIDSATLRALSDPMPAVAGGLTGIALRRGVYRVEVPIPECSLSIPVWFSPAITRNPVLAGFDPLVAGFGSEGGRIQLFIACFMHPLRAQGRPKDQHDPSSAAVRCTRKDCP